MTYTNSSDDFDFEFLRDLPVPNADDSEWVEDSEGDLSCQECEYYNDNGILPCAVNPEKVYHPDDCQDYSIGENND